MMLCGKLVAAMVVQHLVQLACRLQYLKETCLESGEGNSNFEVQLLPGIH